uniref:Uncharacterized protein n=1 Tax=Anopheles atroparvus TaxID=41427 RepID=A0A182J0G9_ANOAO
MAGLARLIAVTLSTTVIALGVAGVVFRSTMVLFVAAIVVGDAGTLVALDGGGGGGGCNAPPPCCPGGDGDEEEKEDKEEVAVEFDREVDNAFRWCACCVEGDSGTGVTEICARTSSRADAMLASVSGRWVDFDATITLVAVIDKQAGSVDGRPTTADGD